MKFRVFLSAIQLVLLALWISMVPAQARTQTAWQSICWSQVQNYDVVRAHFQHLSDSPWDSNLTVNGVTIASTGNGSGYSGYRDVPGSGIRLGWVFVGGGFWSWLAPTYNPRISYGECSPTFEDTGFGEREGYFWFEGAYYLPSLSVAKSASPRVLLPGVSGQFYRITITVSDGPTTARIYIRDVLPEGVVTSGAITATGGSLSGCPGAGASNINSCFVNTGANGPIVITVPVTVSGGVAGPLRNLVAISGGGDPHCNYSGACATSTSNAVLDAVDDVASPQPGLATTTDVSINDTFPNRSTFTVTGGTCSDLSPQSPETNKTGVVGYTLPVGEASCTVVYKLCAPSPNTSVCDSATLYVGSSAPTLSVSKALGSTGRVNSNDQFTVQIKQGATVTASGTSTGTGSTVGAGTTGVVSVTAGTAYTITEIADSGADLAHYASAVSCSNSNTGGTDVSDISALDQSITPAVGDVISCTITNTAKVATLQLTQAVQVYAPAEFNPPLNFVYTGNNGWQSQALTAVAQGQEVQGATQALGSVGVDTSLTVGFPQTDWTIGVVQCSDTNAAASGNPASVLLQTTDNPFTIPAANVRAGAKLACLAILTRLP